MITTLHLKQPFNLNFQSSKKTTIKLPLFIIVFFSISFGSFAQQKPSYNLLWKISGNGLTKPSYLFGTMHVKDSRAFGFSDSVMVAIQKCSAFALEIHPDTMIKALFNKINREDTSLNIKKILSKEEYILLAKRFKEKNGYSIDEINPLKIEGLLKHETDKPGDKPTFVDAYLYGIARTQNKRIYGLENAAQQVNDIYGSSDELKNKLQELLVDVDSTKDAYKESMIKVYNSGNLDSIYNFIKYSGTINDVLTERNMVMRNSIIKQLAFQNIFVAVGVAHLPGETGLINLLRSAGYVVTAEKASFTGVANNFKVDYFKMKWETYTDSEKGFSMETPGPTTINTTHDGLDMVIYPDMANDVYYGGYAIPKAASNGLVNTQTVIQKIVDSYAKNSKYTVLNKKNFIRNGLAVTDMIIKSEDSYERLQLMVANNILYCLYIGNKLSYLNQPYAERFFNSFKNFSPQIKKPAAWIDYQNQAGAFKIQIPVQPEPRVAETPDPNNKAGAPYVINMYMANDKANMMVYLMRYNDYPAGNYLADKTALFDALAKEFSTKGKILGKPATIFLNGYEGRKFKIMLSDKYYSEIRLYVRGNRVYFLLKENATENSTTFVKDNFFESFSFLPFQEPEYYDYEPTGENFKVKLATKPLIKRDTTIDHTSFVSGTVDAYNTNPNSGGVYVFEYSKISDYYRTKNLDSLYSSFIKKLVKYTDTLLRVDTADFNGEKGRLFVLQNKKTKEKQSKAFIIDNGYFYFLATHVGPEEQDNNVTQKIFSSLSFKNINSGFDIYSSKAEKIEAGLLSADTSVFESAKGALDYYAFSKDELPVWYRALQKNYADDTLDNGVRSKIIKNLKKTNDDQTVKTLQTLFDKLNGKDELRSVVMTTIADIDKKNGYDIYLKLLTTTPLKVKSTYEIFTPLSDSTEYTLANFKSLLPLMDNENYRKNILQLTSPMLYDSKKDTCFNLLKSNFNTLTKYANADLNNYLANKDSSYNKWASPIYRYLRLMTKIKGEPLTDSFTNKLIKLNPKGSEISEASITRIKNGLPVSPIILNRLMDSISTRFEIMQALYEEKQFTKIPLKYKTPTEFAKLCLYQYAEDDDDHPDKLTLLGTVANNGSLYYTYKFSLPNREKTTSYLGIAGPFKPGSAKLDFSGYNAYTSWEIIKANWQLQAKKLIPELAKQQKANK